MKKILMALLGVAMLIGGVAPTFATGKGILVLYNGQTEVNRETYKFLMRNLQQDGVNVTLSASQDPKSVKPGTYQAILVLSTGQASGLDPVLKSFIDGYSAKNELYVVSLLKGSTSLKIEVGKVTSGTTSVDAVTAASKWSEGSDKMTYIQLHAEWIKDFAAWFKAKA